MKNFLLFTLVFFLSSCTAKEMGKASKEISSEKLNLEKVYEGKGVVWSFDFIDKKKLLVAHREGNLYLFNLETQAKEKLSSPDVYSKGQGGLLDVEHLKVKDKEYVYMTYSKAIKDGKAVTALARGEFKDDKIKNLEDIFVSNADGDGGIHFGSRIVFQNDSIFMSIGERGEREKAQSLKFHNGTVVRLTMEGKPHPENPFYGKEEGLDEIYSYGHRNPQGMDIHPGSGKLYSAEMGPRGGDELNFIQKGLNYGWPVVTYGREYYGPKIGEEKKPGVEQPVTYWTPSISPSGMAFYTGDKISEWKNKLFLGCLSGTQVRMIEVKNQKVLSQTKLFQDMEERFRSVGNGPDGFLYLSTDSGKIYRVSKK